MVLFAVVWTVLQAVKAKTNPRKTMFFEERKNCGNLIFNRNFCIVSMFRRKTVNVSDVDIDAIIEIK